MIGGGLREKRSAWIEWVKTPLAGYAVARSLFVRGLAMVYLIAVVSWWVQMEGLVGSQGLVPMADYLRQVETFAAENGSNAVLLVPSIFWVSCDDLVLNGACLVAVALALMVIVGFFQAQGLALLWVLYLSLVTTGSVFMSFQWDGLLLEAGLLAVLVAPWKVRVSWRNLDPGVPRFPWYLVWFLLFRLVFFAGYVKLNSGDDSWWDGTAMLFHYQTQPLPTSIAWWMQQLPAGFNRLSCWLMLLIELVFPFFIFMGKRMRLVSSMGICGLMLLIMVTGNFTYFNGLTMVLCLPLVADRFWPRPWLQRVAIDPVPKGHSTVPPGSAWLWAGIGLRGVTGVWLLVASVVVVSGQLAGGEAFRWVALPRWALKAHEWTVPIRSVNGYGLFRVMTKDRPEIIFEGSRDGKRWEEYRLKYKPGELEKRPRLVAPHQPRLDWQLWFAALERQYHPQSRNAPWLMALMSGLLDGKPEVLAFFEYQPFRDRPPKYARAKLYLYEFTNLKERRETGQWWKRKPRGLFFPEIRKREP
jgi:hypothetical protein